MNGRLQKYLECVRLNARVIRLAWRKRWLGPGAVADSYDRLAGGYDEAWQTQLRPATDRWLSHFPALNSGPILELGCGTGYVTAALARMAPAAPITALDSSAGMLAQARPRMPSGAIHWQQTDMLEFLQQQPSASVSWIVSGWAIGYSQPQEVIHEAGRVLQPGGGLAFIVNYADTLRPIQRAFRKCMARFPRELNCLAKMNFPRGEEELLRACRGAGLRFLWRESWWQRINPPETGGHLLDWLLETGVLAGYERMLPLRSDPEVGGYFEKCLRAAREPIRHHYMAAILRKT